MPPKPSEVIMASDSLSAGMLSRVRTMAPLLSTRPRLIFPVMSALVAGPGMLKKLGSIRTTGEPVSMSIPKAKPAWNSGVPFSAALANTRLVPTTADEGLPSIPMVAYPELPPPQEVARIPSRPPSQAKREFILGFILGSSAQHRSKAIDCGPPDASKSCASVRAHSTLHDKRGRSHDESRHQEGPGIHHRRSGRRRGLQEDFAVRLPGEVRGPLFLSGRFHLHLSDGDPGVLAAP